MFVRLFVFSLIVISKNIYIWNLKKHKSIQLPQVYVHDTLFLLGVYCGNVVPDDLPQAERFWLKFKSTSEGVGGGFLARYTYGINCSLLCIISLKLNFLFILLFKLLPLKLKD